LFGGLLRERFQQNFIYFVGKGFKVHQRLTMAATRYMNSNGQQLLEPMGCIETELVGAHYAPTGGRHGRSSMSVIFLRTPQNAADPNGIVAITENFSEGRRPMVRQSETGWLDSVCAAFLAPLIDSRKIRITGEKKDLGYYMV
jgi:hypothetical protein